MGVPGYGVESPYAEDGAVRPARDEDRPWPTGGYAPPTRSPGSTDYIPAHGYNQPADDPERGHAGGGWFAGPDEDSGGAGQGGYDQGGYDQGGYDQSGYRSEAGGYGGADYADDGLARPSDPYAALADLAPRPSAGGEDPAFGSFQPTHRGGTGLADSAPADADVSHSFPKFQPARRSDSNLDDADPTEGGAGSRFEAAPRSTGQHGYAARAELDPAARQYGYAAVPAEVEPAARQYGYAAPAEVEPAGRSAGQYGYAAPGDGGEYSDRRPFGGRGELGASSDGVIEVSGRRSSAVPPEGHRRRALVLLAAVLGVTMAVSVGYVVLRPGSSDTPTAGGVATAPATPDEAPVTDLGELPASIDPATTASTPPASTATSATSPAAGNTGNGNTGSGGTGTGTGGTTAPRPTPTPTPTATASRPAVAPTPTTTSAAPPARLTAEVDLDSRRGPGGFLDVVGTVRVSNRRDTAVADWTVRLTVPGGGAVTVTGGDVSVVQDGEAVTFRATGAIAANASVTFTFEVAGALPALPGGCTVDGNACS